MVILEMLELVIKFTHCNLKRRELKLLLYPNLFNNPSDIYYKFNIIGTGIYIYISIHVKSLYVTRFLLYSLCRK